MTLESLQLHGLRRVNRYSPKAAESFEALRFPPATPAFGVPDCAQEELRTLVNDAPENVRRGIDNQSPDTDVQLIRRIAIQNVRRRMSAKQPLPMNPTGPEGLPPTLSSLETSTQGVEGATAVECALGR